MNKFKLAPIALAVATIVVPNVYAQQSKDENQVERIMVTGSRIARAEVESTSPITVVSKEQLLNIGVTDVSSALRRLPALTGNTANNQTSSGANSIQTATLRGIEPTNTLILLNGRRIVGSDEDGWVDLSSIPFEAISEIQVLKDGASAIYGSDAIAGVVNIITKTRYDGVEVNVRSGISSEGDANERKFGITIGNSNEKGSFLLAASVTNNEGWEEKDRYMTKDANQSYLGGANTSSGTAPQTKLEGFGLGDGAWTFRPGSDPTDPTAVTPWDYDTDGYNYRDAQSGANDNKTTSVFVYADYQLNDSVTLFGEFSMHDGFVQGNQAPPGTSTGYYAGGVDTPNAFIRYTDDEGNWAGVGANQKYNPFGEVGNISRRFTEYGSRLYKSDNNITRLNIGLEGDFADNYNWDLVFSSQNAELITRGGAQPSIRQIERALADECETEADPNCVALDVFGPPGSITQEMLDFINTTAPVQTNRNELSYIQGSVSGPIFELPAGDLMFAVGMEHREEKLSMEADISQRTATFDVSWGGTTTPVISPTRKINEAYLEFAIPVLEGLDIEAAVRYTKYSDIDESTTNPKLGVIYSPMDMIKFRASFSTGFRAPTMAEMYQGRTSAINTNLYDPCNQDNDTVVDNVAGCEGLEDGAIKNEIASYDVISGGNPRLKPEEADNMTLGLVIQPLEDLSFTFDYYEIDQSNVVFASTEYVIDQNHLGNPTYADGVIRAANGKGFIQTVFAVQNNIAERHVAGFDINANYRMSSDIGDFVFNMDATIVDKFDVQDVDGSPFRDVVGRYDNAFGSIPETKVNLQVDWSNGNWRATYDTAYVSEIEASADDIMDSTLFHNAQVGYYLDEYKIDLNFGIHNIFDKEPPFLRKNGTSTDDNLYSFRGRFLYLGASIEF